MSAPQPPSSRTAVCYQVLRPPRERILKLIYVWGLRVWRVSAVKSWLSVWSSLRLQPMNTINQGLEGGWQRFTPCLLRSLAICHNGRAAEVGSVGESVWTGRSSRCVLCMYTLIDEAALMAIYSLPPAPPTLCLYLPFSKELNWIEFSIMSDAYNWVTRKHPLTFNGAIQTEFIMTFCTWSNTQVSSHTVEPYVQSMRCMQY